LPYQLAVYLNTHPEELERFFQIDGALELFGLMREMLKEEVRRRAVIYASRLVLKVASQVARMGYRSGPLVSVKGDGTLFDELNLEKSLENHLDEPAVPLAEHLWWWVRSFQRKPFVLILDRSYSMRGLKIVLAAIAAASVALSLRTDYALLAFGSSCKVIKPLDQQVAPEVVVDRVFSLTLENETNLGSALQEGLNQLAGFDRKYGLVLTDGAWNAGPDPAALAARYDRLDVVCFPPGRMEAVEKIARAGKGAASPVTREEDVPGVLSRVLNAY
jgi:hypothetical protein